MNIRKVLKNMLVLANLTLRTPFLNIGNSQIDPTNSNMGYFYPISVTFTQIYLAFSRFQGDIFPSFLPLHLHSTRTLWAIFIMIARTHELLKAEQASCAAYMRATVCVCRFMGQHYSLLSTVYWNLIALIEGLCVNIYIARQHARLPTYPHHLLHVIPFFIQVSSGARSMYLQHKMASHSPPHYPNRVCILSNVNLRVNTYRVGQYTYCLNLYSCTPTPWILWPIETAFIYFYVYPDQT